MESLFNALNKAIEQSAGVAVTASLVWGVLSVILSPCHLTSIPLVIAYVSQQGVTSLRRAFFLSTLFAAGILASIIAIGLVTMAVGRVAGDIGRYGNYAIAAVFFIVGLVLLDVIEIPWSGFGLGAIAGKGALSAVLLGLVFGAAVGPCTFSYMAPVLAVVFKVAPTNAAYAALLVVSYGIGHVSVVIVAGTFTKVVQGILDWNQQSRGGVIAKRACGVLVILGGLYIIYKAG